MAQVRYRANITAKDFVFSSQGWGRSVVMKQYDQNFSRQIVSPTDPDKDIGIPQIFYAHNVMPCAQGFQSVGLVNKVANTGITGTAYQLLPWQNTNGNSGYILITITAKTVSNVTYNIYGCALGVFSWTLLQTVNVPIQYSGIQFTSALVQGTTYIYTPFTECHTYDGTTWSLQTLTGLTLSQVQGIIGSFGYMIAFGPNSIAWSSTVSVTDFTPSLITGAGGGSVTALRGTIQQCIHHTFGFIVFSQYNAVAAVYSGNPRYPFNFREVIGSGGLWALGNQLVDLDSETGNLYALTSAGIQIVSVTQAQVVHPEVTNYLDGTRFEDFNDGTLQFSYTDVAAGYIWKQLKVVLNRYLVISYAYNNPGPLTLEYTHALVYDMAMHRWGKIRFTHVAATELYNINASNHPENNARAGLGFIDPAGNLYAVDFSELATTGGTIFLGKYQHSRDRLITLQQVDLEYIQSTANLTLRVFTTLDGKTFQTPVTVPPIANTQAPQFPCRVTGMNHSICLQGVFKLDSLMLTYQASGRR